MPFSYDIALVSENQQEAKLSLGEPTVLPHSTFVGHVTSSVTWPFGTPCVISYWWSFPLERSLYLQPSLIYCALSVLG